MSSYDKGTKSSNRMNKKQSNNFLVTIYHTENHSIQGVVQWLDTGKKVSFRSDFELLMLLNEAVGSNKDNVNVYRHWNDDQNNKVM